MSYKRNSPIPVVEGGTGTQTFTNTDGVVYYDGTKLNSTTVGTSGQVLTSNGAGMAPTFQTISAGTTTFNADTGSATPSSGIIIFDAITQAGASVSFSASGNTVSLNTTDVNDNTFIGFNAGSTTTSGTLNTSLGFNAGKALTSGSNNTFVGVGSGRETDAGSNNTGVGYFSLFNVTSGTQNTAVGGNNLNSITTGGSNIAIGYGAGQNNTGNDSSNIYIGNNGNSGESSTIRIGSGSQTSAFMAGIAGVSVSNVNAVTINTSTGQLGSQAFPASSISITGDSGGALTGAAFTFTGGSTGLTFSGASSTETLGGTLAVSHGGTNATSFSTSSGIVKYDGTRLVTSSTAQIDSSNRMTNTSQPAFFAYLNATVNNVTGDGTTYTVLFNATLFDQASNFNTGTGTFTAPVAGVYTFNMGILGLSLTTSSGMVWTLAAGGKNYILGNNASAFTGNNQYVGSWTIKLSASDTAVINFTVGGGTKTVGINGDTTYRTFFSGYLVC